MGRPRERLDHRECQRDRAVCPGLRRYASQVVAGPVNQLLVGGAGCDQRLEGQLDVDWQAGRAALVRLEPVAEPAVLVLIAAKGVENASGGRAEEAGGEEPALQ